MAVAIPANLAADRVGRAIAAAKPASAELPADVREALRIRRSLAAARPVIPRTVEDIR
jgi:hypothetical protein